MKFGNLEKLVIEGSRHWIKFSKDDSPQTAPNIAEEKFPQFGYFIEAPASPEIGTDANCALKSGIPDRFKFTILPEGGIWVAINS